MKEGLPVKGYQPQSEVAVETVNINKDMEERLLRHLDMLMSALDIDHRWLAIGRTSIEQGFMAINRAVFKPQRFRLDGDPE